jgi:hypothetical protein
MSTEGVEGFVVFTHNYGATAAFWKSFGFEPVFETDHASGQWSHPKGGPYVFIAERPNMEPSISPIVRVPDAATFSPDRPVDYVSPFEPQHWGVLQAIVRDPDGKFVSLQAPLPS